MVKKCPECQGKGIIGCHCAQEEVKVAMEDDCSICESKGEYECPTCGGGGWVCESSRE